MEEPAKKRATKRSREDPFEKIKRLKALYDHEGAITQAEFDDTKQQLLAQI